MRQNACKHIMYTSKLAPVGNVFKNNHGDTVYVMANRLLGYRIYIVLKFSRGSK